MIACKAPKTPAEVRRRSRRLVAALAALLMTAGGIFVSSTAASADTPSSSDLPTASVSAVPMGSPELITKERAAAAAAVAHGKGLSPLAVGSCTTRTTYSVTVNGDHTTVTIPTTSGGSWDCLMEQGYTGVAVSTLQSNLQYGCGLGDYGLVVDGIYGPATAEDVAEFQGSVGLDSDGIYGTYTAEAMYWPTADGQFCASVVYDG